MGLNEFSFPIRVYWDLKENRDSSHFFIEKMGAVPIFFSPICDELIDIKVLNLNLLCPGPSISGECFGILERLKTANMSISLTVSALAADKQLTDVLEGSNVRALFVEAASIDDLESSLDIVERHNDGRLPLGISFKVDRGNFTDLPEVLSLCSERGLDCLVIPMQRLMAPGECFYITGKEREALELELGRIAKPERLKIVINDPFLWSAFFPEAQYPECGCQAANSMLYISPEFDVYPCPAMPLKLGTLREATLKEIVLSAGKKELRKLISVTPDGCCDCPKTAQCLGGCRGRAYALKGSLNAPDPACK